MTIERVCQLPACATAFQVRALELARGRGKYCSVKCRSAATPSGSKSRIWRSVARVCEYCDATFEVKPWQLKADSCRFCSRACYFASTSGESNANWKGGLSVTDLAAYRRLASQRRRAQERANGGSFTWAEWLELKALFLYTCPACLLPEPKIALTIDHVVPIAKGGEHSASNIQPLCLDCNRRKNVTVRRYLPPDAGKVTVRG